MAGDSESPNTTMDPEFYRRKRNNLKGQLTKTRNEVNANGANFDEALVSAKLARLDEYMVRYRELQDKIEELDGAELEKGDREKFEDSHEEVRVALLRLQSALVKKVAKAAAAASTSRSSASSTATNQPAVVEVRHSELPKIDLPVFDGKFSEWSQFWSTFKALVDGNENLHDIVKFQHLRSCLRGAPLTIAMAPELDAAGYVKAKEDLIKRYENKRLMLQTRIADIFDAACMSKNTPTELRNLFDGINGHLGALQLLGNTQNIVDCFLIHLVSGKLSKEMQARWERAALKSAIPTWEQFSKCLNDECQALEQLEATRRHQSVLSSSSSRPSTKVRSANSFAASGSERSSNACPVCSSKHHKIYSCPQFTSMSVQQRQELVKGLKLCFNCLSSGHGRNQCHSGTCRQCRSKHHILLHVTSSSTASSSSPPSPTSNVGSSTPAVSTLESSETPSSGAVASTATTSTTSCKAQASDQISPSYTKSIVLLATAIIEVQSKSGIYFPARAMLDSGSQMTFISEHLTSLLGLPRLPTDTNVTEISGTSSKIRSKLVIRIRSRFGHFERLFDALVIPKIVDLQPASRLLVGSLPIPPNLTLADPQFAVPQRIDLLLGADVFFELLMAGRVRRGEGLPTLQETLLGWVVVGPTPVASDSALSLVATESEDKRVEEIVRRFWRLDELPQRERHLSPEEVACEDHFRLNHRREEDGRFSVLLPHSLPSSELGESRFAAERRLCSLERRFARDADFSKSYSDAINGFLGAGFAEYLDSDPSTSTLNYLPHHGVCKVTSSTTKLRPVFDASCARSSGRSLNDILLVGPVIQDDLFTILLRGRTFRYMIMADIAKMYLQVVVRPPDNDLQCILWRDSPGLPLRTIRLNRVTFGTAPASFLAVRCLHELADRHEDEFPTGAAVLRRDFYVDNMVSGSDSPERLRRIRGEATDLLALGRFPLRKWATNCSEVLAEIPEDDREEFLPFDETEYLKTVGLIWLPREDCFTFVYNSVTLPSSFTRRSTLSLLARIYDLLGLINPVVTRGKILIQVTWSIGLGWDEPLPSNLEDEWRDFFHGLPLLSKVRAPHHLVVGSRESTIELHGFSDASERAYGAVIYLRSFDVDGTPVVRLVASKSRVSPMKTQSIARLELNGALLLSELLQPVLDAIDWPSPPGIHLWTDSTIVLAWLRRTPSSWTTYVANRVAKIQESTSTATWRHVAGAENPADFCSRGLGPKDLVEAELWWKGPNFLEERGSDWPVEGELDTEVEARKALSSFVAQLDSDFIARWIEEAPRRLFVDFFVLIRRVVARMWRLFQRKAGPRPNPSGPLSADYLLLAETLIVRIIQQNVFAAEYAALSRRHPLSSSSPLCPLAPYLDDKGLIRFGGRLKNADIPFDQRHQILLPRSHPFVDELFRHYHERHLHVGPQNLLTIIRSRYWPLRGKETARAITRSCHRCRRYGARAAEQLMGDLPAERVNVAYPFEICGVDLFGPVYVHYNKVRGKTATKAYVALFICCATKAVHLELVRDLSSEAFLRALKRFSARKNRPMTILSDNATNFTGACNALAEARRLFLDQKFQQELIKDCAEAGITWRFIPPNSPAFGGLWEAGVKQAKGFIRRATSAASFTEDELDTILAEIENILNSRPLVPLSSDPNDCSALTPNHLLKGHAPRFIPEPSVANRNLTYLSHYQRVIAAHQLFWREWSSSYLNELQTRTKWFKERPNINVGDLVWQVAPDSDRRHATRA